MTLNANFAGARVLSSKLEGSDRGLDALIGLVILVAELLIGFLGVYALFLFGTEASELGSAQSDAASVGFAIAVFGGGIAVGITTLVYLVRVATGRRSWRAPLVGVILMTVALLVGYFVMALGASG
jgi:hypothetical protein